VWSPDEAREAAARHGFEVLAVRFANMLPLTVDHPLATRLAGAIWTVNRLLSRLPGLNWLATNVELDAVRR
jgi:hypothetical protein